MNLYWLVGTAAAAFAVTALIGKWMVPLLRKLKYGQTILDIGPKWHIDKQGTPTMGGLMFIIGTVLISITSVTLFIGFFLDAQFGVNIVKAKLNFAPGLVMALLFGGIGFLDDYIKVVKKQNLGLRAKQKLVLQFFAAAAYLFAMHLTGADSMSIIPFAGEVELGLLYYPIAAVLIVGIVNAVNLTDGIDGLLGSVTFFVSVFFMVTAKTLSNDGASILSASLAGSCLGFLVWNFNPAKAFMGDTGSLFLGGAVCAIAFSLDMPVILIPMGLIYLAEMFSVILQVLYFKKTKGKRLFKMSPIHHHYEMLGFSEKKITLIFSTVTIIACAVTSLLVTYWYSVSPIIV